MAFFDLSLDQLRSYLPPRRAAKNALRYVAFPLLIVPILQPH